MAANTINSPQVSKTVGVAISASGSGAVVQDKEYRDQIMQEIENKSKSCSNPTYECSIPRLDGYDYCIRHILRDPRGAYRQCTYVYSNGKKCLNAVQKLDTKKDPAMTTFCFEHSRQIQLQKTHSMIGKLKHVESNEVMLNNLSHHLDTEVKIHKEREQDEEIDVVSPAVEPYISYERIHDIETVASNNKKKRRILDYASDSSEEGEPSKPTNITRALELHESENEYDSPDEDYLKRAGVYTRQEALRISEAKMTRLQELYKNQIGHLNHLLRERRRRYLRDVRKERETYCSIHNQLKDSPEERRMYEEFKSLNKYHRRHGQEAVLYKKYKEKRARLLNGSSHKTVGGSNAAGSNRCIYSEGGVKCAERPLPCTKYCRKHILEDKKQTLFRACNVERGGVLCQEPVICIGDETSCILHFDMPQVRQFAQRKYESETEEDEKEIKEELKDENKNLSNDLEFISQSIEDIVVGKNDKTDSKKSEIKFPITAEAVEKLKEEIEGDDAAATAVEVKQIKMNK